MYFDGKSVRASASQFKLMINEGETRRLCEKNTNLSGDDIDIILDKILTLPVLAKKESCDVFIDCPCPDPHLVIAVACAYWAGTVYSRTLHTEGLFARDADEPAVFRTLRYGVDTNGFCGKTYADTKNNIVYQDVKPIKNGTRTIGVLVFERRVTEEQEAADPEKELYYEVDYESYPYLRNMHWLAECIDDAVIVLSSKGLVVFRNEAARKLYLQFGCLRDILYQDYTMLSMHGDLEAAPGIEHAYFQKEFSVANRYYSVKQYCYLDTEYLYILLICDITQQKQNEEKLAQKTMTIRESHHRIKNNLQTVYSLLDMQRRRACPEAAEALQDAMNRITGIATTYDAMLRQGPEVDGIGDAVDLFMILVLLKENFEKLIKDSPIKITVQVQGDRIKVMPYMASNISLVINELLQNSYKYAFQGRTEGHICIGIAQLPLYSRITYSDDGIGFDANAVLGSAKDNLGLQIVNNIIRFKLKGRLDIRSNLNGTVMSFDFAVAHK
ncbi:MAG: histidine kinase N-terminal domain-containing protein [Pseudoflavonifractor sp.]|nr:histidine kinase N-terminal domain-containing protein [Pseudoflavonifractor sp.]